MYSTVFIGYPPVCEFKFPIGHIPISWLAATQCPRGKFIPFNVNINVQMAAQLGKSGAEQARLMFFLFGVFL